MGHPKVICKTIEEYDSHFRENHPEICKNHPCNKCEKTFSTLRILKLHKLDTTRQHIFDTSRHGALWGSETSTSKLKAFDYLGFSFATFIWNNVALNGGAECFTLDLI